MAYFSTSLNPGVVFRVPAIDPVNPYPRARSLIRFDLGVSLPVRDEFRPKNDDSLGCNSAASGEEVEGDTFS